MSDLQIELPYNEGFEPGTEISVRVRWKMDRPVTRLEARLVWNTSGKGDRDLKVVKTVRIDTNSTSGDQDVTLTLPWGPYSFSGKLISIIWAVELVVFPDEDSVRQEFVMGPAGREVVVGTAG